MIVRRPMRGLGDDLPKVTPGLTTVKLMKILGVTMSEQFNFDTHVNNIVIKARQSMYALRVLTAHGLKSQYRSRYLPESYQSFEQLCRKADSNLFSTIISNPAHVLHQLGYYLP